MIIKNTTDKSTPKVIGIGTYWLAPGEEKYIPNDFLYIDERDRYGKSTGKKIVLPAIQTQASLGMISYTEDRKEPKKASKVEKEPEKETGDTVEPETVVEEQPVEEKKTTTRAKRAKKTATAE